MRVAIRADASVEIGSGHVMRCLALAGELQRQGASVRFLCRELPDALAALIHAQGHGVYRLPPRPDWSQDAADTQALIEVGTDWLAVDHYQLGIAWETALRARVTRLMVIDDLGREHQCDLLLDQNLQADGRCDGSLSPDCVALLGPRHCLLRAEFAAARSRPRPRDGRIRRLLVAFGGGDTGGETLKALAALAGLGRDDLTVDVVIASGHPLRARIEAACRERPNVRLHVDTTSMATLMRDADLALGAGGGMAWERCCMGLPAVVVAIADNQDEVARQLAAAGGQIFLGPAASVDVGDWGRTLERLLALPELVVHLGKQAARLVDGRGAMRVARQLLGAAIDLRLATSADSAALYAWRNHPDTRAAAFDPAPIALETHERWLAASLGDPGCILLIGEQGGEAVGVLRYDLACDRATVSVYLVPGRGGQGLGTRLLLAGERWLRANRPEVRAVHAEIRAGNAASVGAFANAAYVLERSVYVRRWNGAH